jgi:hypothetical protein
MFVGCTVHRYLCITFMTENSKSCTTISYYCGVDVLTPINTTTTPTPSTPVPTTHTDTSLSLIYIPGDNLVSSRVTPWLALAIVRAICCSVSWILVVWISDYDRLLGEHVLRYQATGPLCI